MGPVWALLLLLFPVAQGADCDARQNNIQCYGALGGSLQIQLMDKGSTERCAWDKKGIIFEWRNKNVTTNKMKDRSEFNASTGIFYLHNLLKDDSGSYTLQFLDQEGKLKEKVTHELIIEAPVSSVQLEPECLSKGEMKVTCTAEGGDSPEFSWTLDGQTLTDSQLPPNNEENDEKKENNENEENDESTITLKQNTEGLLRCSVSNHVSQVDKELNISTCGYTFINCTLNGTQISDWIFEANNTLCIEHTTPATTPPRISPVGKTLTPFTPCTPAPAPGYFHYWLNIARVLVIVLITAVVLFCVVKKKCWNKRGLQTSQPRTRP